MNIEVDIKADWIAVDWGTSHLRVASMAFDGSILAQKKSNSGMNVLSKEEFEPALLDLIDPWLKEQQTTNVICCGMVGARQGWAEAPYRTTPCKPFSNTIDCHANVTDQRLNVFIIQGLKQQNPADVLRGEETQIAGLLTKIPNYNGVICLPGTHSKWALIKTGEVVEFTTHMTGEIFALLAEQSVLRHSIACKGWDEEEFLTSVNLAVKNPEMVAAKLFSLRAEQLIGSLSPITARARLSGLLIGLELAATRSYWQNFDVTIIGADNLARNYNSALKQIGRTPNTFDAEKVTFAGLARAHRIINQES